MNLQPFNGDPYNLQPYSTNPFSSVTCLFSNIRPLLLTKQSFKPADNEYLLYMNIFQFRVILKTHFAHSGLYSKYRFPPEAHLLIQGQMRVVLCCEWNRGSTWSESESKRCMGVGRRSPTFLGSNPPPTPPTLGMHSRAGCPRGEHPSSPSSPSSVVIIIIIHLFKDTHF